MTSLKKRDMTKILRAAILSLLFAGSLAAPARAEVQVINGVRYECSGGLCRPIDGDAAAADAAAAESPGEPVAAGRAGAPRIAQGYMDADAFLAFLRGEEAAPALPTSVAWLVLSLLLAGLATNLTPCVLPLVPVSLAIVGRSFGRGLLYGLGLALAYGTLGLLASVGGLAFGAIQANPVFNACVALVFAALGLSLCGVFTIDFARGRTSSAVAALRRFGALFPFLMGVLTAVLAGACVAPVLVSTLVLTADLFARGSRLAPGLPFVFGVGMALPWPFLGAGLNVLPKPGAWMRWVSRAFALVAFAFAAWYGWLAADGCRKTETADFTDCHGSENPSEPVEAADVSLASPASLESFLSSCRDRPVLVDCWASWCKNCAAMEKGALRDPRVAEALKRFRVVRLRAEDVAELRRVPGFENVRGLPAFAVFERDSSVQTTK
jgi:thioredoxin:protein disulfide reductase